MLDNRWKILIEGIGVVAIVASLIFVGVELKQSREVAVAGPSMR